MKDYKQFIQISMSPEWRNANSAKRIIPYPPFLKKAKERNHPYYYHWKLAIFSGMKNSELYALRWADVDLSKRIISIKRVRSWMKVILECNSEISRNIPIISRELMNTLKELKSENGFSENIQGRIFNDLVLPRIGTWRHEEQSLHLKKFCKSIGIKPIEFHDLWLKAIEGDWLG